MDNNNVTQLFPKRSVETLEVVGAMTTIHAALNNEIPNEIKAALQQMAIKVLQKTTA